MGQAVLLSHHCFTWRDWLLVASIQAQSVVQAAPKVRKASSRRLVSMDR